jgi:hypothetical protein
LYLKSTVELLLRCIGLRGRMQVVAGVNNYRVQRVL